MRKTPLFLIYITVCFVLCLASITVLAEAGDAREILNKYIADLQKNPLNMVLREQIIKLALTLDPAPGIPDEVATYEGAAEYAFKNAKTEADYIDAAKEYEKALLAAPWLAADYFNCGVAYEKAGNFEGAIRSFNFYLMAAPDAPDVIDVRKRIGGLKYAAEKALNDERAATEEKQLEMAPKDLSGIWWAYYDNGSKDESAHWRIQVKGDEVLGFVVFEMNRGGELKGTERLEFRAELRDRTLNGKQCLDCIKPFKFEGMVTEDFMEINCRVTPPSGVGVRTWSLRRE